jgi:5-oxoprolinase (ATP-hydrolysing)
MSPETVADGFIQVAVDNMANAIKRVSIQRGHDPREFTLCCFGGAGGQHACRVADQLGIESILIHPLAGVLSAYGMGVAPLRSYRQRSVGQPLDRPVLEELGAVVEELGQQCLERLTAQGVLAESCELHTILDIKVAGSDTSLPIAWDNFENLLKSFRETHRRRFGFNLEDCELHVESLRVEAIGRTTTAFASEPAVSRSNTSIEMLEAKIYCGGDWCTTPIFHREQLEDTQHVSGPALIVEDTTTTVVEPGWELHRDKSGHLILSRTASQVPGDDPEPPVSADPNPIMMEVFNNHFMNVAEQMGSVLENTAHSVNIKERLDFSCALFDRSGDLVANAPHIPVHLGAMGDSIRAVIKNNAAVIASGDVYMLNSPFNGGSHLPDITVITPVFDGLSRDIQFFVACRAHHADIGGITPGSMAPGSRRIEEEGALFDNFRLVEKGTFREAEVLSRLAEGPFPARNPEQNIADLRAQVAANEHGVRALGEMIEHFGRETVLDYMDYIQANAEESVRSVIDNLHSGKFVVEMDGGETVRVKIEIDKALREAIVDFSGTSSQTGGNLNAPISVTRAAVLYVFRTMIGKDIPLNAGCMKPIRMIVPEGSLLNPRYPAAVVAGNVETSQCVTNALYGALNVLGGSQSSMNNLTFGDSRYQYYETICGGSGAGATFDGTDAVHTHMTNSRMTDPEVLEARFPVIVREFAVRRNSGGSGRFSGGDGVVRRIEFRRSMQAAILSNNRRVPPFGMNGGEPGAPGRNYIIRNSGKREELAGVAETVVEPGDVLVIETPGGGGFGTAGTAA